MTEPNDHVLHHLDSDDELFDQLENELETDNNLVSLREQRLMELKCQIDHARLMKQNHHGTYLEMKDEKEILQLTTTVPRCVVHFFHPDFRRCAIIDRHLEVLATKHFKSRFVRVNVENVPFLVDRLKIQILPCVVFFIDSISKDRLIGFEELGNTDNFSTAILEKRLLKSGVITPIQDTHSKINEQGTSSIYRFAEPNHDDDADDDSD